MRAHQPRASRRQFRRALEQFGMDEIHRPDIQRRRHRDAPFQLHKLLDEIETDLAVIQTAIDMCRRNRQQRFCTHGLAERDHQAQGTSRRLAARAVKHRTFVSREC